MEKTPAGTSVGVEDPYHHVEACDHLAEDNVCRYAVEHGRHDPDFSDELEDEDYVCPVAGDVDEVGLSGRWRWSDCPHFRSREHKQECTRCGLEERRVAHEDSRPLLEEHHLSYREGSSYGSGSPSHEITVYLCRWCHAKVHDSWARVEDDVEPDAEAIAEYESRRSKELDELGFTSAEDRFDRSTDRSG